jgi:hypothetical protein
MSPKGSHNQEKAKPSPNLQIKKQLTTGDGKNYMKLNTLDASPLMSPWGSRLHYLALPWWLVLLPRTHRNTELHTPPLPHNLLPSPWNSRETNTSWLLLLNGKQKVQASRLRYPRSNTTELSSLKPIQEIGPRNTPGCRYGFWSIVSRATKLHSLKSMWEIGPGNYHCLQA